MLRGEEATDRRRCHVGVAGRVTWGMAEPPEMIISKESYVCRDGGVVRARVYWTFSGAPWVIATAESPEETSDETVMEEARENARLMMEDVLAYMSEFGALPFDRGVIPRVHRRGRDGAWRGYVGEKESTREEWLELVRRSERESGGPEVAGRPE